MNILLLIILITTFAGVGGTGLGGLVGALFQHDSKKVVSLLLSFAGGVMLSVVCFDLVPSAIHPENAKNDTNIFIVCLGIVLGFIIVYLLNFVIDRSTNKEVKHIDSSHPKTADDLDELIHSNHLAEHQREKSKKSQLFVAGVVMACAIALHNLPEGMVIGASFAGSSFDSLSRGGLIMAVVIGLHNIPEGMAVSVPLISGGMKKPTAIIVTALSGAPTIIGAILGYYLGMLGPMTLSLSLSFASGAMLYVVLGELIPESILMWKSKKPSFSVLVGAMVGLIMIYI